jgi:hypothetical protein
MPIALAENTRRGSVDNLNQLGCSKPGAPG